MDTTDITLQTGTRTVTDVTEEVRRFCSGRGDGLVHVFLPHATAGVALMETGSGSESDLDELLGRLLPRDDRYRHRHGSPGHGGDHLLPVMVSPSLTIPVGAGRPLLGTWQSVVVVDLMMPGAGGLDVLRRAFGVTGAPPIVIVTALGQGDLIEQALAAGAAEVVHKPFTAEAITTAVGRAIERSGPR